MAADGTDPSLNLWTRSEFFALVGASALGQRAAQDPTWLVRPGDARYEALRARYNATIDRRPRAIAACRSADDVAQAVRFAAGARLPIAIRSGGHSFEGFSTNDDGLVVDVSALDKVRMLPGNRVAVGPGCTLARLNDALLPRGRLLPAGSCGSVGVAGLTLGGGYGFFSRAFGLTCDHLESLTLIDAAGGERSTADDPELLWACRGGGNGSFGVVTELVFRTQAAPAAITRHRLRARKLDGERAASLLAAWFAQCEALPDAWFSAFVLNHATLVVLLFGPGDGGAAVDRILRELGRLCDETQRGKPQPLADVLRAHYGREGPLPFKNACAGLYRGYEDLRASAAEACAVVTATPGLIFQVNTLGGAIRDAAAAKGSCYPHRDRPWLGEVQAYWEQPARQAPLVAALRKVQAILRTGGITAHYANYPDLAFTDWAEAYYGANHDRLRAVKRRLDPDQRFRHPQSIRP